MKRKRTEGRNPPETYFEAAFIWRVLKLRPAEQIEHLGQMGKIRRRWIEIDWLGNEVVSGSRAISSRRRNSYSISDTLPTPKFSA